ELCLVEHVGQVRHEKGDFHGLLRLLACSAGKRHRDQDRERDKQQNCFLHLFLPSQYVFVKTKIPHILLSHFLNELLPALLSPPFTSWLMVRHFVAPDFICQENFLRCTAPFALPKSC